MGVGAGGALNVDSQEVASLLEPQSVDELAEALRSPSGTIAPVGSGAALSFGNPLDPIDTVVRTCRLERILEYVPDDLTIHVAAGMRLDDLQSALAEHNQMIPLDPWNGGQRTLGGIIATNAQGPLRAVGTVRDWIIGMKVVHAGGRISRTGGRVVKNVSGYDLAKLYTGSLGSLAVISEVSLRVTPVYQRTATARVELENLKAAWEMTQLVRSSPLDPISLVWTGPANRLYIRFGDATAAVDWQVERLPRGDWEVFGPEDEDQVWKEVHSHHDTLGGTVVRVAIPPARIGEALRELGIDSWLAHAASGVVLMAVPPARIRGLRGQFPVVIERAPLTIRRTLSTFGLRGTERQLMRDIKSAFDPDQRLNPGRHVDGELDAENPDPGDQ